MCTFTTKAMDPLKKKRIEEAIIKYAIVENETAVKIREFINKVKDSHLMKKRFRTVVEDGGEWRRSIVHHSRHIQSIVL